MNAFEYHGHTIEVKPFVFSTENRAIALPPLHDVYVDGLRRNSGFLSVGDAELYGRSIVDDEPLLMVQAEE
jgi:hypothetical protein